MFPAHDTIIFPYIIPVTNQKTGLTGFNTYLYSFITHSTRMGVAFTGVIMSLTFMFIRIHTTLVAEFLELVLTTNWGHYQICRLQNDENITMFSTTAQL